MLVELFVSGGRHNAYRVEIQVPCRTLRGAQASSVLQSSQNAVAEEDDLQHWGVCTFVFAYLIVLRAPPTRWLA
jgi:hypothetical protein